MAKKAEKIITVSNAQKYTGVHYTTAHNGKMSGMQSLSTSCKKNINCERYSKVEGSICQHCFARRQMAYMTNMEAAFARNTEILTSRILNKSEIPLINAAVFRFESFGDINNVTQVINYFNICKTNKDTKFALWTKNPWIVKQAIEEGNKKPGNLQILLSSIMVNQRVDLDRWDFVDKVFTVYDKDYIKEHPEVDINCGAKSCLKCKKCYKKSQIKYINEVLK